MFFSTFSQHYGRPPFFMPGWIIAFGVSCFFILLPVIGYSQNDLRLTSNISNSAPIPECEIIQQEIIIENKSDKMKEGQLDVELSDGLHFSWDNPNGWQLIEPGHAQCRIQIPPTQTRTYQLALNAGVASADQHQNIRVWITETPAQQVRMSTIQVKPQKITDLIYRDAATNLQGIPQFPGNVMPDCDVHNYYIDGTLDISNESHFENRLSRFIMGPESSIRVKPGGVLNLQNVIFSACKGQWKGLIVEEGGKLVMENTFIEDAMTPVLYEDRKARKTGDMFIYPNPAADIIQIRLSAAAENNKDGQVQLMFAEPAGRAYFLQADKTLNSELIRADIRRLPDGVYQVVLIFPDGSTSSGDIVVARQ